MSEIQREPEKGPDKVKTPGPASEQETLNFKVAPDFKKEFKGYAVSHGVTMLELLKEGFELSKRKRQL